MTPDQFEAFYGPYFISDFQPENLITLKKNPFWSETEGLPVPIIEEIDYDLKPFEAQDVLSAYKIGDLDAVEISSWEYSIAEKDSELKKEIRIESGNCGYYLYFNYTNMAPLDELMIRQSISLAIDKQKINKEIYLGTGQPLNQYVPSFLRGSTESQVDDVVQFDPKEAINWFERSNWYKDQANFGIPLYLQGPDSENYSRIANSISADLQNNLGLAVEINNYPWDMYLANVQNHQLPSVYILGYCMDYADSKNYWDLWLSPSQSYDVDRGIWENADFYKLINEASATMDTKQRTILYSKAEEIIINQDTVVVPLVWNSRIWLVKPYVNAKVLPFYQQMEDWFIQK